MKQRITNPNYRNFLDNGFINPIDPEDIDRALSIIDETETEFINMKKAFLCATYLTGGRPSEILELEPEDIYTKKHYIIIFIKKATKKSLARRIYVLKKNKHAQILLKYAESMPPKVRLFWKLKSNYVRKHKNKKGEIIIYKETSRKVRYLIEKWFKDIVPNSITPYFLRHSRFSQLSQEGLSETDIRLIKGAKSMESVTPYLHLSSKRSTKIARKIK